jgi:hypothetical protein
MPVCRGAVIARKTSFNRGEGIQLSANGRSFALDPLVSAAVQAADLAQAIAHPKAGFPAEGHLSGLEAGSEVGLVASLCTPSSAGAAPSPWWLYGQNRAAVIGCIRLDGLRSFAPWRITSHFMGLNLSSRINRAASWISLLVFRA